MNRAVGFKRTNTMKTHRTGSMTTKSTIFEAYTSKELHITWNSDQKQKPKKKKSHEQNTWSQQTLTQTLNKQTNITSKIQLWQLLMTWFQTSNNSKLIPKKSEWTEERTQPTKWSEGESEQKHYTKCLALKLGRKTLKKHGILLSAIANLER